MDTILSVLTSGGVTAVTIVAACKWLTKRIIDAAISSYNERNLANYNSILERQNKIIESDLNFKRHIWESQYNTEFENYLNIWAALQEYIEATLHLKNLDNAPAYDYGKQEEKNNLQKEKWEKCACSFESLFIGKAPFYQKRHYEKFAELDVACKELYEYYKGKRFNVQVDEMAVKKYTENILALNDEILDELRTYLQSLKSLPTEKSNN